MRGFGSIIRVISGALLCTGLALADYQLDFTIPSFAGGTISYAGGTNPLVGTNITISQVEGQGGTQNSNDPLTCTSCVLNFTTGNLIAGGNGFYDFGGGTFTIAGNVAGAGASGTLMSGTFDGTVVLSAFGWDVQTSFFSSDVNSALTTFYGLPATPPLYSGAFGIVFESTPGQLPGSFASTQIMSGNVAASVPEPASMILLGTVLLGCVAIVRRRLA